MYDKIKSAIEEYQCPGCVCGSDVTCYKQGDSEACIKHVPGTLVSGIGKILLGMPKGFNRIGPCTLHDSGIEIFMKLEDGWGYGTFNVPVWKYRDKHGNTIVRGMSPRINRPFIHIFLTDCVADIDCQEITSADLLGMD